MDPATDGTVLAIDLGTQSIRAALVGADGGIGPIASTPVSTQYPSHGYVEQSPEEWWQAVCRVVPEALAGEGNGGASVRGVVACGHMHAPVLVGRDGEVITERVMMWNDKRAEPIARRLDAQMGRAATGARSVNAANGAWPGIKLLWLKDHAPGLLERARWVMMSKDFVAYRLSGEVAMDWTEAGPSHLMDPATYDWDAAQVAALGLDGTILPPIRAPSAEVGRVTRAAAEATGLPEGLPVFVGAGDYPCAVAGSGVVAPGRVSDITGTAYLLTRIAEQPAADPAVMNLPAVDGKWCTFAIIDAAGDAVRWGRALLGDGEASFEETARLAASAPAGAGGVLFLPYLTGERAGDGAAARAAFVGLTASHGSAEAHRAILEGVAFAMRLAGERLFAGEDRPAKMVAAAGGTRSDIWLRIKASMFNTPIVPVREPECGLLGGAAIVRHGLGDFATLEEAAL
ncbi:MAG: FGGY family carbohydrate kinase, partial [Pseudomonadota bacterium]